MATFKRQTGSGWEHISLPVNIGMSPQTLGYAEVTASQTLTANADLTGLTVTVTVPAGRRLRITGQAFFNNENAAANKVDLLIMEGATQLQDAVIGLTPHAARGEDGSLTATAIISPSAGTHTYKLRGQADLFNVVMFASATLPAFILVEDITGSTLPYQPASVPVGRLGYAEITSTYTIGATGTATVIPGLSVNVAVPAGRVLKLTAFVHLRSTVTTDQCYVGLQQDGSGLGFAYLNETAASPNTTPIVQIVSPTAGSHTYTVLGHRQIGTGSLTVYADSLSPSWIMVEDITPTPAPSSGAPGSTLGYGESTAVQSSIPASMTALTGLSSTITVPAGRRLRIKGFVCFSSTVAGAVDVQIRQGGTKIQRWYDSSVGAGEINTASFERILSPSAGTHTFDVAILLPGTGQTYASSQDPNFILVEDITGSVWPEGSAVTAGMIASEAWTSYTPTLTQGVSVPVTVISARYTKMGRTVHFAVRVIAAGAGTLGQPIYIGLPPHASLAAGVTMVGVGTLYDASANLRYQGLAALPSTTTIGLLPVNGTGNGYLGVYDFVAALATNDEIFVSGTYEAAS